MRWKENITKNWSIIVRDMKSSFTPSRTTEERYQKRKLRPWQVVYCVLGFPAWIIFMQSDTFRETSSPFMRMAMVLVLELVCVLLALLLKLFTGFPPELW